MPASLPIEEIKRQLQSDSRPWRQQRWLIIYNALKDSQQATDIVKPYDVFRATMHQMFSSYNHHE
jgi:hypothetical protein